jgi:hypothetical protein
VAKLISPWASEAACRHVSKTLEVHLEGITDGTNVHFVWEAWRWSDDDDF